MDILILLAFIFAFIFLFKRKNNGEAMDVSRKILISICVVLAIIFLLAQVFFFIVGLPLAVVMLLLAYWVRETQSSRVVLIASIVLILAILSAVSFVYYMRERAVNT